MHELGWVTPDAVVHVVNIVRLTKILVGAVTAGTVWSALMDGDEFDNIRGMLREFRDRSVLSCVVREPDAHGTNLKVAPHELSELRSSRSSGDRKTFYDMLPCNLHQTNHITRELMAGDAAQKFVRGLHSLCLLLQSGN